MPAADLTLQPLRTALLADAQATADALLEDVVRESRGDTRDARAEADAMVARARASAQAQTQADARRELAAARRDASLAVLQARRAAYELLRRDVISAALELRNDARYPSLLDRLEGRVRATLGGDARIERDPPDAAASSGAATARTVDATLPTLAEQALEDLGVEIESLWR